MNLDLLITSSSDDTRNDGVGASEIYRQSDAFGTSIRPTVEAMHSSPVPVQASPSVQAPAGMKTAEHLEAVVPIRVLLRFSTTRVRLAQPSRVWRGHCYTGVPSVQAPAGMETAEHWSGSAIRVPPSVQHHHRVRLAQPSEGWRGHC